MVADALSRRPHFARRLSPVPHHGQLIGIAQRSETLVGDPKRLADLDDEPVLVHEVGLSRRYGLNLNEPPEPLDIVYMDANVAPEEQTQTLGSGRRR